MVQEIMFCFIVLGVILSQIGMWKHIRGLRKKIDKIFEGKSAEDIYYFINQKAEVDNSNQDIKDINNK